MDPKNTGSKNPPCIGTIQEREYFAELCALANSGALTRKEMTALNSHVALCEGCRELLQDFRAITTTGMAALGTAQPIPIATDDQDWSVERAKSQLFARIATEDAAMRPKLVQKAPETWFSARKPSFFAPFSTSAFKLQYAAAASLLMLTMVSAYKLGESIGENKGLRKMPPPAQMQAAVIEAPNSRQDATTERT